MTSDCTTDEELFAAHVAGDPAAFRALFDRHAPRLRGLLRRAGVPADELPELLQQTFLVVHRSRNDFDPRRRFRPWITTICLNLMRDHKRRARKNPVTPVEEAELTRASSRADQEDGLHAADVRAAVGELPGGQREVVELHWFGGLSMPEVAEVLGAKPSAVRVRAHRAYKALRTILAQRGVRDA
jgi:RNA polymerase sigma-70 factor (ECF subfamily)